ncbi:sigma 54 modulation/S30EA ribosomal C-terminal domain-containing protein [Nocardia sp. NPDC050193]
MPARPVSRHACAGTVTHCRPWCGWSSGSRRYGESRDRDRGRIRPGAPSILRGPGELVRRKPVPVVGCHPSAAAAVMDAMDYDAHLSVDTDTGEDAIVYRAGPSGLRLARHHSVHPPRPAPGGPWAFTVNPRPAPPLTEAGAAARLCEHGLPFLFYTHPRTGRGLCSIRRACATSRPW